MVRDKQCTIGKPLMISIPQGQTIKIDCPVHGSHTIGNAVSYTY